MLQLFGLVLHTCIRLQYTRVCIPFLLVYRRCRIVGVTTAVSECRTACVCCRAFHTWLTLHRTLQPLFVGAGGRGTFNIEKRLRSFITEAHRILRPAEAGTPLPSRLPLSTRTYTESFVAGHAPQMHRCVVVAGFDFGRPPTGTGIQRSDMPTIRSSGHPHALVNRKYRMRNHQIW